MSNFKENKFEAFDMFDKNWAIATGGSIDHFNGCTVSWGSLGNIWGSGESSKATVTVYIHPARYTSEFMKQSDIFTVSFFPKNYKKALGYFGSHSGRDTDKPKEAGLTPVPLENGVTYKEADLTFVCKKLYQHQFSKKDLAPEIQQYYASYPNIYTDFKGGWEPHIVFIGEVIFVEDKRES